MTDAPAACPFTARTRAVEEPDPDRAALHAAGPVVRAEASEGGPAWIVTDAHLARQVLTDQRFAKDTALAPPHWDHHAAGLEPTAAQQLAVTTLDGPAHHELRRAFVPLLRAARLQEHYDGMLATARRLLDGLDGLDGLGTGEVDLMADFTSRYPLTILCDLLGVPPDMVDTAVRACALMHAPTSEVGEQAMARFAELAAASLGSETGLATELAARMPPGTTREDLHYQIFTLLFAGQLTTDLTIGFLVARLLGDPSAPRDDDELVAETLRTHPPAPFTLWRFTTTEVELAGTRLPPGAPVLVDIAGINARTVPGTGDLAFGAGPHYCLGVHLARLELRALAETLRRDRPHARLAVPYADLRQHRPAGIMGERLGALPVVLGHPAESADDRIAASARSR